MKTGCTGCNVKSFVIHANVKYIYQVLDDLTKSQCNNSQVVTAETKYRNCLLYTSIVDLSINVPNLAAAQSVCESWPYKYQNVYDKIMEELL